MCISSLREKLEDDLRGHCIADFITRKEMMEYLADFDEWAKTAKNGDTYYFDCYSYTLQNSYKIVCWENEEMRDVGEPVYMTPICSDTDLEAIKSEVESYDTESSGCVEIFVADTDELVLHYENNEWVECVA